MAKKNQQHRPLHAPPIPLGDIANGGNGSDPVVTPNVPVKTNFLSLGAIKLSNAQDVLGDLGVFLQQYSDLGYAPNGDDPIVDTDAVGTLKGFGIADLAECAAGFSQIQAVLSANDGALRKAMARCARFKNG